jgi:hypothetical protein
MYNGTLLVEKKPTPRSESLRGVSTLKTFPCRLRSVMHSAESLTFANCSVNSQPYAKIV